MPFTPKALPPPLAEAGERLSHPRPKRACRKCGGTIPAGVIRCRPCKLRDSAERNARRSASGEHREYMETWRRANRDRLRGYKFKSRYGITIERYDQMHAVQRGLCAICDQPETAKHNSGVVRRLSVDHDHETGQIRGLLCSPCNHAIGLLRENPTRLHRAIAYLEGAIL